ncbi:MAG: ATP-binding protein [Castellaniella sp.]|uniref:P-loop ATPase, Sll1717 family n=1 Tax=Castellaniella sp. TaxID=1955812 RepID=UPI003C7896D9
MAKPLSNPLGDIRAEADHAMLAKAFYETPDYLSLLESDEKIVVVGRRGTGKSALTYRLKKQWSDPKNSVFSLISPEEHQTLALAPLIARTGSKFLSIRASSRLLWRYGLMLEITQILRSKYKLRDMVNNSKLLTKHLSSWGKVDQPFFGKLRTLLQKNLLSTLSPDDVIGHLADVLEIAQIEKELKKIPPAASKMYLIVDRLDEGFDPDGTNIAFIDGAITAAIDVGTIFKGVIRPVVFLRDNIHRAVAHYDQDYARNIEGQTLRLHWDAGNLFYLVCNRLRAAFGDETQNNKRLWSRYTAHELQGEDGFKQCLKFTLYRPRDILILLNSAFENASKRDPEAAVTTISLVDLEKAAKTISNNRLDDLQKEYRHIFPSIESAISVFGNRNPELLFPEACELLDGVITSPPPGIESHIELAILNQAEDLVRALYGIGFLGVQDASTGSYVFSHDGRRPDTEFESNHRLLIHPCYWIALNLTRNVLSQDEATDINDEYEIKVSSVTPILRNARLGRLISEYQKINSGAEGAADFEQWCLDALRICFAGRLDNIVLHPNKDAVNRRDVVGTNLAQTSFWKRIQQDYETRQVVFEIKNYESPTLDDYRQVLSYLSGGYGRLAFIICRGWNTNLERDKELSWVKSIYSDHRKIIVKITGKFLSDILSKFRNPQKHDSAEIALGSLMDTYERMYLGQQSGGTAKRPRQYRSRSRKK